ncbi:hypothetical protein EDB81DRAFT_895051 [Dactylonectria macrodidyma]|uniref:Uncharacterized protein n=1 Tax=Dactylonectria macrodidyma TaxID=307937 RepID=A0A9P9CZP9_9HYPO|nr:hypothetical protein EDB81DRAFT_895051 [Dactylonectria macrodidyma]
MRIHYGLIASGNQVIKDAIFRDNINSTRILVVMFSASKWNLNMEATLAFQQQHKATLRIFISEHKWKDSQPTEEEALMILNHSDDSAIPVPAVFMFVPGMPVVVNNITHQF